MLVIVGRRAVIRLIRSQVCCSDSSIAINQRNEEGPAHLRKMEGAESPLLQLFSEGII